jgi:hypothetical protein
MLLFGLMNAFVHDKYFSKHFYKSQHNIEKIFIKIFLNFFKKIVDK